MMILGAVVLCCAALAESSHGMRFENIKGSVKGDKAFDLAHAPEIVFEKVCCAIERKAKVVFHENRKNT